MAWFAWVLPLVRGKEQLALALYLYRRCYVCGSRTVTVPTGELEEIGIGRWGKYRLLPTLEQVGIVRVEETRNGQAGKVTLLHWPDAPD